MRFQAAFAGFAILLTAACSSSNKNTAGTATALSGRSVASPAQPTAGPAVASQDPATRAASAAEEKLTRISLQKSELPPELQLSAKRPFSNKDYAATQADAASFEQTLTAAGRISGVLVTYTGSPTPPANTPSMVGLLEVLSSWRDEAGAKTGLADSLKAVTPQGAQPNTVEARTEQVDLGKIGDEVSASHLHVTSLTSGQPESDAYVVGVRKGSNTAVLIFSGVYGAPALDQVKQIVEMQAKRLG